MILLYYIKKDIMNKIERLNNIIKKLEEFIEMKLNYILLN